MSVEGELKNLSFALLEATKGEKKPELRAACFVCKSVFVDDLPIGSTVYCPRCFPEKWVVLHRRLDPDKVKKVLKI